MAPPSAPMAAAPASASRRRAGRGRSRAEMGLAAGGRMEQKIYPDEFGIETWDQTTGNRVFVHIVNSQMYRDITGRPAPESPVSARDYARVGYPWFELYDEHESDIPASTVLAGVDSVADKDAKHGFTGQQDDSTVPIPNVKPAWPKDEVADHTWYRRASAARGSRTRRPASAIRSAGIGPSSPDGHPAAPTGANRATPNSSCAGSWRTR